MYVAHTIHYSLYDTKANFSFQEDVYLFCITHKYLTTVLVLVLGYLDFAMALVVKNINELTNWLLSNIIPLIISPNIICGSSFTPLYHDE